METTIDQHNVEIQRNLDCWNNKPVLRKIYRALHERIAKNLAPNISGKIVELGSGIGNIAEVIPNCIRTDLFPNPWIDQVESAYKLSFADKSVSHIVLFDVFHHLRYPGTAFAEFERVLVPGGRVIMCEPYVSFPMGALLYGLLHHEPIAWRDKIEFFAPSGWSSANDSYYAAQGNATRIFFSKNGLIENFKNWRLVSKERLALLSYALSGGYSKPQMYPDSFYPLMQKVDAVADLIPGILGTRALVTLER